MQESYIGLKETQKFILIRFRYEVVSEQHRTELNAKKHIDVVPDKCNVVTSVMSSSAEGSGLIENNIA